MTALRSRRGFLYLESPLLAGVDGLVYAVTTRIGGTSTGPRRFLNLSPNLPADPAAVTANRQLVCQALGIDLRRAVFADQVHGAEVAVVGEADAGTGAHPPASGVPAVDGLLTGAPDVYLVALSADCPLVALVDPVRRAVAVVHSGRKGTVADIVTVAIRRMGRALGSRPADLLAVVAPSIGPCCYEIGPEVADEVRRAFPTAEAFLPVRASKTTFDLRRAIRTQLRQAGLTDAAIEVSDLCTACRTDLFYSYRAEGSRTGRFAALVGFRARSG